MSDGPYRVEAMSDNPGWEVVKPGTIGLLFHSETTARVVCNSMNAAYAAGRASAAAEREGVVKALEQIRDLKPTPFNFPADWHEQIDACPECARYKAHPIQQGICDKHRRPLWEREKHENNEEKAVGYRAIGIAREALAALCDAGQGVGS